MIRENWRMMRANMPPVVKLRNQPNAVFRPWFLCIACCLATKQTRRRDFRRNRAGARAHLQNIERAAAGPEARAARR
jgi:hypothetical protein